jgi:hypothetical protein
MPRLRNRGYDPTGRERVDLLMALRMGPDLYEDGFTDDELRVGWELYGDEILDDRQGRGPGTRPWGWWRFVAGEEQPRERWNPETKPHRGPRRRDDPPRGARRAHPRGAGGDPRGRERGTAADRHSRGADLRGLA